VIIIRLGTTSTALNIERLYVYEGLTCLKSAMSGVMTEQASVNNSCFREFAFKTNISPNRNAATLTLYTRSHGWPPTRTPSSHLDTAMQVANKGTAEIKGTARRIPCPSIRQYVPRADGPVNRPSWQDVFIGAVALYCGCRGRRHCVTTHCDLTIDGPRCETYGTVPRVLLSLYCCNNIVIARQLTRRGTVTTATLAPPNDSRSRTSFRRLNYVGK